MTLASRLILIAALILSIIIPFGYYLLGRKRKGAIRRPLQSIYFSSLAPASSAAS